MRKFLESWKIVSSLIESNDVDTLCQLKKEVYFQKHVTDVINNTTSDDDLILKANVAAKNFLKFKDDIESFDLTTYV